MVSSLASLLEVVATPPYSFLFLSTDCLQQNRDRPACAFWSLPWGIQIVKGRWEAAERQLEPWWTICYSALHPTSHLGPASCCFSACLASSLWVPCNTYPQENIYNLPTSWGLFFFLTSGAGNDKTLPRFLLSELNYVFALMPFILGLLIYFLSLEGTLTKQR